MDKPHKHAEAIQAIADGIVDIKPYVTEYEAPVRLPKELDEAPKDSGQRIDIESLVNIIRSFGYTTWAQSYELATAILQKVGAK